MADACIFGIIISKLGHGQESGPIILFKIDEDSKIGLYGTILPFCLAVCLRVKSGGEAAFDPKEIIEQ